jgi:hypothetical protein
MFTTTLKIPADPKEQASPSAKRIKVDIVSTSDMSADTASPPAVVKFHPDYSTRKADDAVLLSADGISFYFSLPLLAQLSSFFANLSSLPRPSSNEPVELLSAPTKSLRLVLGTIRAILAGEDVFLADTDTVEQIAEALVVTDAYDLPLVGRPLIGAYYLLHPDDHYDVYALAGILGD